MSMPGDDEIAQAAMSKARPIVEVARRLGFPTDAQGLLQTGPYFAKVDAARAVAQLAHAQPKPKGQVVVVTAMTPQKSGSGKTLSTIGLMDGLNRLGGGARQMATAVLRQPSLGPVFGMKGGAAGGGYAQLLPSMDINLHFTGDIHAITAAHNLLFAMGMAYAFQGKNVHQVDLAKWTFPNAMDMVDRSLRDALITPGGQLDLGNVSGAVRARWVITAASEVMATLGMSANMEDLGSRLGRIALGSYLNGKSLTALDVEAVPAMQAILLKALHPNVVQSLEGNAALVHTGPFANIAHGNPSVTSLKLAAAASDVVLTEAGFAADLGAQKFLDLVCPAAQLTPAGAVVVCSTRDLARQGKGNPLAGVWNLVMHVENLRQYGIPVMAVMNRFHTDSDADVAAAVSAVEQQAGVRCVPHTCFRDGGKGGEAAAAALLGMLKESPSYKPLYDAADALESKVETVARRVYRAGSVVYAPGVQEQLRALAQAAKSPLQVCMAKTQFSISDDGDDVGDPTGKPLTVTAVRYAGGPGWVVVLCGKVFEMPGMSFDTAGARRMEVLPDATAFGGYRIHAG